LTTNALMNARAMGISVAAVGTGRVEVWLVTGAGAYPARIVRTRNPITPPSATVPRTPVTRRIQRRRCIVAPSQPVDAVGVYAGSRKPAPRRSPPAALYAAARTRAPALSPRGVLYA